MSRAYDSSYRIEAARKKAIFDERVSRKTTEFYNRYMNQYKEMIDKGFDECIPVEMKRLKEDLAEIRRLLTTNPAEAREESQSVGSYINGMFELGRSSQVIFIRNQKLKEEERLNTILVNKNEGLTYFYKLLNGIKDPVIIDFAKGDIEGIKEGLLKDNNLAINLEQLKKEIDKRFKVLIEKASVKANEWKINIESENESIVKSNMINEISKELKTSKSEDRSKIQNILEQLEELKKENEDKLSGRKVSFEEINTISKKVDDVIISEEVRKEVVKGIIKSLRNQEFYIEEVKLIETEKGSFYKVIAKKESGKHAECRVLNDGRLQYKFDNYKGMTCIKEIEKFDAELSDIYSVKLSNKKILWENPKKISKDAINNHNTNGRER